MKRMLIIKKNDEICVIPVISIRKLKKGEELVCKVNKPYNPHHLKIIQNYFKGR